MRGFIVAASQSGSGKTAITQALVRCLCDQGVDVLPAKVGPDYIDPQFLTLATHHHRACINIDPWAMRTESRQLLLSQKNRYKDSLLVIEGVMGLFDGAADGTGSSADLAEELNLPIILVVNAAKQSHSIAALVQGFCHFRADVNIAGVIVNNVASLRHGAMLRDALSEHCPDIVLLGMVPRDDAFVIPERHLGLVQAEELADHNQQQQVMAELLAQHVDCAKIVACAEPVRAHKVQRQAQQGLLSLTVQHLAIARDAAFGFTYAAQLQAWQDQGHELSFFSPLADEAPDPTAEGVFLCGGYPELYAAQLAQAQNFISSLRKSADQGVSIHGECGGYMVLGSHIIDHQQQSHAMVNLLPVGFHLQARRRSLGYRQFRLRADHLFGKNGEDFRGHEFHYGSANMFNSACDPLLYAQDARGDDCSETGMILNNVSGSFIHFIDKV